MYVSEPLNPTLPTDLSLAHDCEKGLCITPSDRRYHLKCFKKNKTRYAQKCNKISPPLTYHKVPPLRKDISKGKKKSWHYWYYEKWSLTGSHSHWEALLFIAHKPNPTQPHPGRLWNCKWPGLPGVRDLQGTPQGTKQDGFQNGAPLH